MIQKVDIQIVERLAPKSGPTSSADYNATQQEVINSFAQIANSWNNSLQPLLDTLPSGSTTIIREDRTSDPNPYINGFDGSQIYMDCTSTEITDDGKYFDTVNNRPITIKESFEDLSATLSRSLQDISVQIAQVSQNTGVTPRQKQAIGSRIFDSEQVSSPGSLDGITQTLIRYTNQLQLDLAGSSSYLNGSGVQTLNFPIFSQISAIQAAHSYNAIFNTLDHSNLDIHTHKYFQVPVGDKNAINKTYYLPGTDTFKTGTLQVFENGETLRYPTHYSELPNGRGWIFSSSYEAPESDDDIWAHYILR